MGLRSYWQQETTEEWDALGEEGPQGLNTAMFDSTLFLCKVLVRMDRRVALVRWELIRDAVRARGVVVFWMGEAAKAACAPGGAGRQTDAVAFANEFV